MHGESIVFITGRPVKGCLLFAPDAVLAVTNAAADVTYSEGADYLVDPGARRLVRPAGSRMPATAGVDRVRGRGVAAPSDRFRHLHPLW